MVLPLPHFPIGFSMFVWHVIREREHLGSYFEEATQLNCVNVSIFCKRAKEDWSYFLEL